jgi:hypothetical protein
LVGDVRRVVHNYVEAAVAERKIGTVPEHIGPVSRVQVQGDDGPTISPPEPAFICGGIQNSLRKFMWIESEHTVEELRIIAIPYRRERTVAGRAGQLQYIRL